MARIPALVQRNTYSLVNIGKRLHNYGTSPFLMGRSTTHGAHFHLFSIAMIVYRRVWHIGWNIHLQLAKGPLVSESPDSSPTRCSDPAVVSSVNSQYFNPWQWETGKSPENRWSSTVHAKVCDVPLPRLTKGIVMFLASITFPRLNHHFYLRICWSRPTKKFRNALPYRFPTLIMFNYYVLYIAI